MKIALLLTGHPRGWKKCYDDFKSTLLEKHDVDIYISTWSSDNQGRSSGKSNWMDLTPFDLAPLIGLYNPKNISALDPKEYYKNRFPPIDIETSKSNRADDIFNVDAHAKTHGSFWAERLRDMHYVRKIGYQLIENPDQYDIIFLSRIDCSIKSVSIKNLDTIVVPDHKSVARCFIGPSVDNSTNDFTPAIPFSITDHMAYGSPEKMKIYCDIVDHIPNMYYQDNVNITHAESMLGIYLMKYNNIDLLLDPITYNLCPTN